MAIMDSDKAVREDHVLSVTGANDNLTPPDDPDSERQDLDHAISREANDGGHKHQYIFERLRRPMAPPSKWRGHAITAALMTSMILCGWNEGSAGPLIPSLQVYYGINYLVMSLIYTTMFAGSLIGGLSNVWITDRIGFGLVTPLGALANAISFMLCGTGAPYAVFLIGYAFNGLGLSLQDAQVNNITSRLPHAHIKMSIVQACFSIGGTISPFISTAFAQHVKETYRYFFVAMGIAIVTIVIMFLAFEGRTEEQIVGNDPTSPTLGVVTDDSEIKPDSAGDIAMGILPPHLEVEEETAAKPKKTSSGAKMKRIFRTPAVWALMAFSFLYVGIEVAISGWLTSFLIKERGGSAAAGYATTGFWGGMSVGRIVLLPVTAKLGNQVSIYVYATIALALELVIWFTKSLIGNGVCFAFVGFFLGPIYPVALMVISEVLDDDLRGGVMGLMGSMGGAGAAAVPFITGGIADRFGIWTIQPVAVSMIAGFTILWALVPRRRIVSR